MPPHLHPEENTEDELKASPGRRNLPDDQIVTPDNLDRAMSSPSISSDPSQNAKDPDLSNAPGFRAAEAYVRPTATVVAGRVLESGFDLRNCEYKLRLDAPKPAKEDAPTIVFVPEYHFPKDDCQVEVSSGKWELSVEEDKEEPSTPALQRLKWWHGDGEQTLRLNGTVRRHNLPDEGTEPEPGVLEQCRQQYAQCSVM